MEESLEVQWGATREGLRSEVKRKRNTCRSIADREVSTASFASFSHLMLNPLQKKSGGRMVYTVPLIIFMDNISGNISKQWNKHHVIYMLNALLPQEMIEQEFTIRFISGSPHASPMDLMQGIKDSIE